MTYFAHDVAVLHDMVYLAHDEAGLQDLALWTSELFLRASWPPTSFRTVSCGKLVAQWFSN
eukprot:7559853-Pyramimonas_sp.AAC.1